MAIPSKPSRSGVDVWDCGSSLYDSFELNSLKRQLDSAIIASRTFSMPHLPSRRLLPPPPPPSKRPSKISRSVQKFLRSVFRQKPDLSPGLEESEGSEAGLYVLYGDEVESQKVGSPPGVGWLVRRTASERFTASIGISCA